MLLCGVDAQGKPLTEHKVEEWDENQEHTVQIDKKQGKIGEVTKVSRRKSSVHEAQAHIEDDQQV